VVLLLRPESRRLTEEQRGLLLRGYWRLLFHGRVHLALRRDSLAGASGLVDSSQPEAPARERGPLAGASGWDGKAPPDGPRRLIQIIGQAAFDEIALVLRQENRLLSPDDAAVYEEFVSLYLELRFFAPDEVARWFPGLENLAGLNAFLDAEVPGPELYQSTRPEGALEYLPAAPLSVSELSKPEAPARDSSPSSNAPPAPPLWPWLPRIVDTVQHTRASHAAHLDNHVRAAILLYQLAQKEKADSEESALQPAYQELAQLAFDLERSLKSPLVSAAGLMPLLAPLLPLAALGRWSREARLLYDLQKVAVDAERELYTLDPLGWLTSLFHKPFGRPLPYQRRVLVLRHLRQALQHVPLARLEPAQGQQWTALLSGLLAEREGQMRQLWHGQIEQVLQDVGLKAGNYAEKVARNKLIEELLDRAIERGFLTMSDLRDAIARNRIKLPDLAGPGMFLFGDPLLQANRKLGQALEGVYRPGEIYLRLLQWFSSLAFGTAMGRFLTLFLVIPFGGAFLILEFLQHLVEPIANLIHGTHNLRLAAGASTWGLGLSPGVHARLLAVANLVAQLPHKAHFTSFSSVLTLGLFLLGLLHSAFFRRQVGNALCLVGRGLHGVLIDLPALVLSLDVVLWIRQNTAFKLLYWGVFKPAFWAFLTALLPWLAGAGWTTVELTAGIVFVAVCLLLNSKLGQYLEETVVDGVVWLGQWLRQEFLPNLLRTVVSVFRFLLDEAERLMYTVDQWLRFRKEQGLLAWLVKPILGLIWSIIRYVLRLIITLFIEPQINPVKHFPVVTVGHKLMLLILEPAARLVATGLGWSFKEALTLTGLVFALIPGIFGFLVWELKENWRLYQASQSPTLEPVTVGAHGETIHDLVHRGFHSGTLARIFTRLRRASAKSVPAQREALHHVETALKHFVERDLLAYLAESKKWPERHRLTLAYVHLASNRIRLALSCERFPDRAEWLLLDFEDRSGWLLARVAGRGWLARLQPHQARFFRDVLAGFYKLAGASLIEEQIRSRLPAGAMFDVQGSELVVWPAAAPAPVRYDLNAEQKAVPKPHADMPSIPVAELVCARTPIWWRDWVSFWERDQDRRKHPHDQTRTDPLLVPAIQLLPPV